MACTNRFFVYGKRRRVQPGMQRYSEIMVERTTLRDVAREAGVSVGAVSLILNGKPNRISEETRKLVFAAARKLHYVPNQNARALVTSKSMLIALIIPDIENMFFASLAHAVEVECQQRGYSLIIANSNDLRAEEHDLIGHFIARGVDGMILIPAHESLSAVTQLQQDIAMVPYPVIFLDRLVDQGICDGVGFDNWAGGHLAAQCLVDAGHRKLGCIAGGENIANSDLRRQGFEETVEHALHITDKSIVSVDGDYRFSSGYGAGDTMIDSGVTGVFCGNDLMALGLLRRLHERGLHCPEDISIIGYDNILHRFGLQNEFTTVEQDVVLLGHEGCELLFARIHEQADNAPWINDPQTKLLQPKLVDNGTVRYLTQ